MLPDLSDKHLNKTADVWLMKHLAGCRTLVDLNALPWDKILKVP